MNWKHLRRFPWLDTRARFVAETPRSGALLDLGASEGETLRHLAELRPDLRFFAVDLAGRPENYPPGCQFHRANLERDRLPWPDQSMDAVTCMQLVEHLQDLTLLTQEIARLLKREGRVFFETPHPRTLTLPSITGRAAGSFTMNFFDDSTHVRLVAIDALDQKLSEAGLEMVTSGTSRNWLLASAWPLYALQPPSRRKFTSRAHWLGWSAYLIARRP